MSGDFEKLLKKWNLIKEQLIALCALNKLPKGNEEMTEVLNEDIELKNLNSQNLTSICYFILGIINCEERDKLIQWPLINIKNHTKFRKGVSAMVKNLQEKYPSSHIKKLPESYFMNPHGNQSKVLDFLLRLTNLAIKIALDDPGLLIMHSGDGLNSSDISTMREVVSRATEEEEIIIKNNLVPLEEIEVVKNEIINKCIALKQKNDDLQFQLISLKKQCLKEHLIPNGENVALNVLKEVRDEKFSELDTINEELSNYLKLSKELLSKIKPLKDPTSLSSKNLGCENFSLDKSTSAVCGNLCQLFHYIVCMNSSKEKEDNYYKQLMIFKESIIAENEAFHSCLRNFCLKEKL